MTNTDHTGNRPQTVATASIHSRLLIVLSALALAWALPTSPAAARQKPRARKTDTADFGADRTVVYKKVGGTALKLYLFLPRRPHSDARSSDETNPDRRHPAIVFFFGGGWRGGTPGQFRQQAEYLAGRGMLAALADYRVYSRHRAKVTQCVADARSAVRFLRQHADTYRIDPNRIAAAGGSAGGHLAAATATLTAFDEPGEDRNIPAEPNALILFNPALDLRAEAFPKAFRSNRYRELLQRLGAEPEALSPTLHIRRGTPPTIIFHGEADTVVPIDQARAFCRRMKELGNACRVVAFPGQGHGFFNFGRSQNAFYRRTLEAADAFLVDLGWLPASPASKPPADDGSTDGKTARYSGPRESVPGTPRLETATERRSALLVRPAPPGSTAASGLTSASPKRSADSPSAQTGRLVEQRSDGWIVLHARDAAPHGEKIIYEPQPHKNTIGYWTVASDWVSWTFRVHTPGRFAIEILQGCGEGNGGSDVEITVGSQRIRFKVFETGHFQNFIPRDVGSVQIERPGRYELQVRCRHKAAKAVMDLRRIRLVPDTDDGSPVPVRIADRPFLRGDEHVVFIGDSITQAGAYVDQIETILLARFPRHAWRFTKLGLSSETVCGLTEPDHPFPRPNLHDRLKRLLEVTRPDVVVACYGMNDGIYHPFSEERFAAYRAGIEKLVAAARAVGARVTLMTPPPFDSLAKSRRGGVLPFGRPEYGYKAPYQGYDEVLQRYGRWILSNRWPEGVTTIDVHEPIVRLVAARRRDDVTFTVSPDGIHPDALGHWVMAKALLGGWGLLPQATRCTVQAARPDGDAASPLHVRTFVPFPVDPDRRTQRDRVAWVFGTRCQTVLAVRGLSPGDYAVREGNMVVAHATAAQLAEGVDVRSWPKSLPVRRATELFELVRRRRALLAPSLLAHIGHKRPTRAKPIPLAEARARVAPLSDRIESARRPLEWSFTLRRLSDTAP